MAKRCCFCGETSFLNSDDECRDCAIDSESDADQADEPELTYTEEIERDLSNAKHYITMLQRQLDQAVSDRDAARARIVELSTDYEMPRRQAFGQVERELREVGAGTVSILYWNRGASETINVHAAGGRSGHGTLLQAVDALKEASHG